MSASAFVCLCLFGVVSAFGAGNIPSYGALEGLAFRHGDIEDILLQLAMVPAHSNFLASLNPLSSAGKKFNAMRVKNVYFGNWLRDYSQAVDVGTLSKGLDAKTIRLLVWVMGFMAFGYATEEFEVTESRLGVYRPEEHIDNPRGYPSPEEPDARKFDPRLRGPVAEVELEIDPSTGMKNYIANERGNWMTSSAYVRNSLLRCIELGRMYKQNGGSAEKYESLRVLGQALHTLEDFSAHSNFCELTLVELGYRDVFCQVGTSTSIMLGNKRVFPLTTGTFGGLDFVHSLLGEATDKISQTQLSEVSSGLASSSSQGSLGLLSTLQSMVTSIPGAGSLNRDLDEMQAVSAEADQMRSQNLSGSRSMNSDRFSINADADDIARKIYPIMAFRDRLMKGLSAFFEKIPGLSALIDRISETLTVWVLSTIEPFMKPIVEKVTGGLGAGQALVTSGEAQLVVFENSRSSDPTHSMLAKDHFSCYLNQPAGLIGQAVVKHTVARITAAWADPSINPLHIINEILEVFHHPAAAFGKTQIQHEMRSIVEQWVGRLGSKKQKILHGLSMDGVRNGLHHEGGSAATTGPTALHSHSHSTTSHGYARQSNATMPPSSGHYSQGSHDSASGMSSAPYNSGRHQEGSFRHHDQPSSHFNQTSMSDQPYGYDGRHGNNAQNERRHESHHETYQNHQTYQNENQGSHRTHHQTYLDETTRPYHDEQPYAAHSQGHRNQSSDNYAQNQQYEQHNQGLRPSTGYSGYAQQSYDNHSQQQQYHQGSPQGGYAHGPQQSFRPQAFQQGPAPNPAPHQQYGDSSDWTRRR